MGMGARLTLRELRDEMVSFGVAFDASLLDGPAARAAVEHASRIVKAAQAVVAVAAARADECRAFDSGARSSAHGLAQLTGGTVGEAVSAISSGRRLADQPDVADAARRGELSPQQTSAISEALAANPSADAGRLLGKARQGSLRELRDECDRVKAAADDDAEELRKRIHDERLMRRVSHADGSAGVVLRGNPEDVARLYAAIAPKREELFATARREGRRERSEALDYDALLATLDAKAPRGAAGGQRAKILVRVDFDALLRGVPIDGEVCEIAGYGPIAVSAVRDLVAAGGFLAAIVTKGERVTGVAHLGRQPRAVQDSALEWLDPICAREGCSHPWVQRDHREDWAKTKVTLVDLMDRLCPHDHDLKTRFGWALVAGRGKRPMVPPDDPRHPDHDTRRTTRTAPARAGPAPPG
jgi:hypothetical protein